MADETGSSSAAPPSPPPQEELSVNISIVSPSPSVDEALRFPGLPASTTVAELKEKIRDVLESKPTNEQQRLIHQGKLLAREQDTLLQMLGEQRPHPHQQQQRIQHYMNQVQQRMGMTPPDQARGGQAASIPPPQGGAAVTPNGDVYRITTQTSALWGPDGQLQGIARPSSQPANAGASGPDLPLTSTDVGNIFRAADATQATARMTDAMQRSAHGAAMAHLNQLHLNGQLPPIQTPGVTVPWRPASAAPAPNSRTATPETTRTQSHDSLSAQSNRLPTPSLPEVYIVNSPQGPRALLMNTSAELYYTPSPRTYHVPTITTAMFPPTWFSPLPRVASGPQQAQAPTQSHPGGSAPAQQQAAAQQAPQQGNIRVNTYQGPAAAQQPAGQPQIRVQPLAPGAAHMHPANPEGNLAAALLAALWPHVWLLIRLAVFVWWFTSANTSWTRWFIIMSLATAVFLVNTGLFNGLANELFQPVRQHLEGLIPFAGPERRRNNAPPAHEGGENNNRNNPNPQAGQHQGEPDPAQAAARLVEQRREQNANWLLDQIRRIERASLLLLASILPGVAERHIARLEAEARAERERQEAAERAEQERREEEERTAAEAASASAATGQEEESAAGDADGAQQDGNVPPSGTSGEQQQQPEPVAAS
ncbi:hypothetical protein M406DRAFT_336270 [Cryphonectria parasitica EP155]|uniref:DSC E3 ubiquitin ligase complex subunit 3 ubiquitin-like domain-containing protein n=1 Tax=Cryphonectria parasitica (strain ATCC 38755 / EP155) TaxID=660469 RepID=A0A9P4YCQ3_CRYP1|nr:uncharacterized protein M406DRAFT_336270 [Cryphonectria parasitica EP155]KAF3770650.1 hypothetical protein M406DRAFT_336270 [Cryphonectria parasitica EP155]